MGNNPVNYTRFQKIGIVIMLFSSITFSKMDDNVPMGWAAVPSSIGKSGLDGADVESTIGGGNGKIVTAKSNGELSGYLKSNEPLVIQLEGSFSGTFVMGSNKTIIGVGSGASLSGGFNMGKVSNIIVRNLKISGGADAFGLGGAHHVWIDHCDLSSCSDGLLDITKGSDNITNTWTKYHNHNKVMLINHGKITTADEGRLNVTLHHLWFENTVQRHPRVGYGQVQVLNNYYNTCQEYAIHVYWNSEVVIERCYFKATNDAISDHYRNQSQGDWPGPGYVVLIENKTEVEGSILKKTTTDKDRIFNIDEFYMYDWVVTKDVNKVPEVVQAGAGTGAEWGKIGPIPTPGQGYARVSTNPTLKWTKVGSKESNKVFFGTSNPPSEITTVNGYEYKPGNLKKGTVYYWKINDNDVWKFRTEGTPVTAITSLTSKKMNKSAASIKKGINNQSKVLIKVQKGDQEKDEYLLNGRKYLDKVRDNLKKTKVK